MLISKVLKVDFSKKIIEIKVNWFVCLSSNFLFISNSVSFFGSDHFLCFIFALNYFTYKFELFAFFSLFLFLYLSFTLNLSLFILHSICVSLFPYLCHPLSFSFLILLFLTLTLSMSLLILFLSTYLFITLSVSLSISIYSSLSLFLLLSSKLKFIAWVCN